MERASTPQLTIFLQADEANFPTLWTCYQGYLLCLQLSLLNFIYVFDHLVLFLTLLLRVYEDIDAFNFLNIDFELHHEINTPELLWYVHTIP